MSQNDDERDFYPDARYAANTVPGFRWYDDRTGQEQWSRPVGVDTLLDAGATIEDPAAVTIATRVKIGPNKARGGWSVGISRERLDAVRKDGGVVRLVGTRTYAEARAFDDREDGVAWAESEVDAYADAEVKSAVEWSENRRTGDTRDTTDEGPTQETIV